MTKGNSGGSKNGNTGSKGNPNWPSKIPNAKSGGNRGNNPPKK